MSSNRGYVLSPRGKVFSDGSNFRQLSLYEAQILCNYHSHKQVKLHGHKKHYTVEEVFKFLKACGSLKTGEKIEYHNNLVHQMLCTRDYTPRKIAGCGPLVYFIRAGDTDQVKIGFTSSWLKNRLSAIQTGNALTLRTEATIQCPRSSFSDMTYYLEEFAQQAARDKGCLHLSGEWFSMTKDDISYVFKETLCHLQGIGIAPFVSTPEQNKYQKGVPRHIAEGSPLNLRYLSVEEAASYCCFRSSKRIRVKIQQGDLIPDARSPDGEPLFYETTLNALLFGDRPVVYL